jgi:lysophospholipase L1-like esterase
MPVLKIFIALIVLLSIVYWFLRKIVTDHKPDSFPSARSIPAPNKKILVCAGDSNTHGNVSHNWVKELQKDLPEFQIINAGLNSDLTFSLLSRLDAIIACNPDYINILIGTNDVNAFYSAKSLKRYIDNKKISKEQKPDIQSFEDNLNEIIQKLKKNTHAKIALMTLPMMGEDLKSRINKIANEYSAIIEKIALENEVDVLPVRQRQKEYLFQNPSLTPYKFDQYFMLLNKSVILHYIFRLSWDRISELNNSRLSPDFLHQNEKAGKMIKDEVLKWLKNDR